MDKVKYLSRIHWLSGLDRGELELLEPAAPLNKIKKGTVILSPLMEQKRLFLIKSGTVRLYRLSDSGKELTMDILGTGHLFGEAGAFTTGSPHLFAQTLEDSVICTMDKAQFDQVVRERPQLALRFIEIVSERLKEVEELLEQMAYGSVRKRLLYLLDKLLHKFGIEPEDPDRQHGWMQLDVSLTHQELASMMGSIRETVTQLLNELAMEGIVRKAGPRKPLQIQPERLKSALTCCV
ncbi:Crp/Fnr family transcriptional regulator [Paenibacillus sp. 32352]|uniref:Crp/Fnr family transcriptional regulator n=1 Tax=Paenibacillus sp. 32352 TaxID=1969111 RepID=UPI0009AC4F75|nr:Crp/Fnr family transcriptional regulator [Paenibacillus sp. 32352]